MNEKFSVLMDTQLAKKVKESANQIWLAGLGAWAKAEEEGGKLFETLVDEGEVIEQYTRNAIDTPVKMAKSQVSRVKDQALGGWERVERVLDERISNALRRFNIPTQSDVMKLQKRIRNLEQQVMNLSAELASAGASTEPAKAKSVKSRAKTAKKSAKAKAKTKVSAKAAKKAPKKKVKASTKASTKK